MQANLVGMLVFSRWVDYHASSEHLVGSVHAVVCMYC